MSFPTTLSVVIPTYQRPDWIQRAVRSLAAQDRPPEEVIPVARDTDLPTHEAIASLQRLGLPFEIRPEQVTTPGFMPPVERGLSVAQSDVIAVMDDDAEATEGWAARILGNYVDDSIGAVGGRCINMYDGKPAVVPERRPGRLRYVPREVRREHVLSAHVHRASRRGFSPRRQHELPTRRREAYRVRHATEPQRRPGVRGRRRTSGEGDGATGDLRSEAHDLALLCPTSHRRAAPVKQRRGTLVRVQSRARRAPPPSAASVALSRSPTS